MFLAEQKHITLLILLLSLAPKTAILADESDFFDYGSYTVGSSDVSLSEQFSGLSGSELDRYLIGERQGEKLLFIDEILSNKDNPLLLDVLIPNDPNVYGVASGLSLPVFIHITYPTRPDNSRKDYVFPYSNTSDSRFEHMQRSNEKPVFADNKKRYPLVLNLHGMNSHGFWSASGPTKLSSHGYIVANLHFGDARFRGENDIFLHEKLRPFIAQYALDFLLNHRDYKDHIDQNRIAASGHSLGGYTALSLAGGKYDGMNGAINKARINAAIASAPWTGANWANNHHYPFGNQNIGLSDVFVPVLGLYGSKDKIVQPTFVLSAFEQLSGVRHVVELVGQPHIYAPGSWQDQSHWVFLFLEAYLKDDDSAQKEIASTTSVKGGGVDRQIVELQRLSSH